MKRTNDSTFPNEDMLVIDKTPTPAEEAAGNFSIMRKIEMGHEINVLEKKQGLLGKITGSDEPSFNIVMLMGVICLVICVLVIVLMFHDSDAYFKALGIMIAPVTTIIGYILGQNKK